MTKIRFALVALTLAVVPGIAIAECAAHKHTTASACAEGQVFDTSVGRCVEKPAS